MGPIAIVGEAGGMRNCFTSGVLAGLNVSPEIFDAAYGTSSAAATLAYFLTGQNDEAYRGWTERLVSPEIYNLFRLLRLQRPANLDGLVSAIRDDLDTEALFTRATPITVGVIDVETAKPEYLRLTPENLEAALKATCAIPGMSNPVQLGGRLKVDGALFDPLPALKAISDGYRNIVVIANKPYGFVPEIIGSLMSRVVFRGMQHLRELLPTRVEHYARTWEAMLYPAPGLNIFVAAPSQIVPVSRMERNPDRVKAGYELGYKLGNELQPQLAAWLHDCVEPA